MKFVAATENGNVTGKIWLNDFNEETSKLVNAADVAEIIGDISSEEVSAFDSLEELNADLYGISFTSKPEF